MDRFLSRREKLRGTLESDDIDALLVSAPTNVSYLTGFSGDSSVLFLGRDRGPDRLGRPFYDAARAGMSRAGGTHSALQDRR